MPTTERTILHVDMDAFFASVEQLHHPEWRGRPVIVGSGPHERGVVSTCSYEARAFGVHSAMPSRTAYQFCPHAIFVRPHMDLYAETSRHVFEVFERFTPYIEGVSIDEAFLDVSGSIHLYGGSAVRLAETLRTAIRTECGVTCSAGLAPNRLLAKIGSEQKKPDGLTVMPFDPIEIAAFLKEKPLRILWGVGQQTEQLLRPYGLHTCGDIQNLDERALTTILNSTALARQLRDFAFGRDNSPVNWEETEEKSVSREHTFKTDESSRAAVRSMLLELVADVARRFRKQSRWARTARLKVRNAAFETITRQISFASPARDDISFREKALELFDAIFRPAETLAQPIRLIGFGVTNFQNTPDDSAPSLFASPDEEKRKKRERLSDALDALRARQIILR